MSRATEMFRFVASRRPQPHVRHRLEPRLVRDRRQHGPQSILRRLWPVRDYDAQLGIAREFRASRRYVTLDSPNMRAAERLAARFREILRPGLPLAVLEREIRAFGGGLASLLADPVPPQVARTIQLFEANLWDSFYAATTIGLNEPVRTIPLADALRVLHVIRTTKAEPEESLSVTIDAPRVKTWQVHRFDDYEVMIALPEPIPPIDPRAGRTVDSSASTDPERAQLAGRLVETEDLLTRIDRAVALARVQPGGRGRRAVVLNEEARGELADHPAAKAAAIDLTHGSVAELGRRLRQRRDALRSELARRDLKSRARATASRAAPAASAGSPWQSMPQLSVGTLGRLFVGDLLLVEQELLGYEAAEIADIQNILKGEQREYSTRKLSRLTETSTVEIEREKERSESITTDERFQLSSQAQTTASQSLSLSAGVSASNKYGPMDVTITANASYSNSKSQSDSVARETARNITETATNRVREAIKESSSVTLLTEDESTSLHGFNNVDGDAHICGIYRWIDKVDAARTVNYGRHLQIEFNVPEPAAFYRAVLSGADAELTEGLERPKHPTELWIRRADNTIIDSEPFEGDPQFEGPQSINEDIYIPLATYYDVADVQPPPPKWIAKNVAVTHPPTGEPAEVKDHQDDDKELVLVDGNTSIPLDPDYRLRSIGAFVPASGNPAYSWYASILKMGQRTGDENIVLLQVGDKSFHFKAYEKDGDTKIVENLNEMKDLDQDDTLYDAVLENLPVTMIADFEGRVAVDLVVTAERSAEAYERWQLATYNTVLQAYERKLQEYEQAVQVAEAKLAAAREAQARPLREEQYRAIEQTEIKRGCIDLLTESTAIGFGSITVAGTDVTIDHTEPAGDAADLWRSPYLHGAVADFFEKSFRWHEMYYEFLPYFWTHKAHWQDQLFQESEDPIFTQFLKAGMAKTVVPVTPGAERPVSMFLRTGLIWMGDYLPLVDDPAVLDVHEDVERRRVIDPPEQVGEAWELRLPTNYIKLQPDDTLPRFEVDWAPGAEVPKFEDLAPAPALLTEREKVSA